VGIELVYLSTDPPVRLLRRLIPPVRLGPISLDLSILILLLVILALYWVVLSLG
jgi:YggT family protein